MLVFGLTATAFGEIPPPVMLSTTLFVFPSIIEIPLEPELAAYTLSVTGFTATPSGELPTVMFPTTLFVLPSITETVPLTLFATYIRSVFGLAAIPRGSLPTIRSGLVV